MITYTHELTNGLCVGDMLQLFGLFPNLSKLISKVDNKTIRKNEKRKQGE